MGWFYDRVACNVVLFLLQKQGALGEAKKALNDAVKDAKIDAEFIQDERGVGWLGSEGELAKEFRNRLNRFFPIGAFETEVITVRGIIEEFRKRKEA